MKLKIKKLTEKAMTIEIPILIIDGNEIPREFTEVKT